MFEFSDMLIAAFLLSVGMAIGASIMALLYHWGILKEKRPLPKKKDKESSKDT